jgi:hypothetical protein
LAHTLGSHCASAAPSIGADKRKNRTQGADHREAVERADHDLNSPCARTSHATRPEHKPKFSQMKKPPTSRPTAFPDLEKREGA